MTVYEFAGKPAPRSILENIPRLVTAYYTRTPDVYEADQRVSFGTSGHRGSSLRNTFNEAHILAVSQAICEYRKAQKIKGPLFLGMDTHALSEPALATAIEVFAANKVNVVCEKGFRYTPTPVISHAILTYNARKDKRTGVADGVIVTPSHNPPGDGGFKYNPPHGGPADATATAMIESRANELLFENLKGVKRVPFERAMKSGYVEEYDYISPYVDDLRHVIDMESVTGAGLRIGADPLGGAAVDYWGPIAERYRLNLTMVDDTVDPTFSFMTVDWDGKIRMDCSSSFAMARLIGLRDRFDIAFGNDTDVDRHGIVTRTMGLMNPNQYLSVAVWYLFQNRMGWSTGAAVGKTLVSTSMIDRIAAALGREIFEVPVGFKWFVKRLIEGSLGFAGEESAGASFLRKDGGVWTTDKDGIIMDLLACEIMARTGKDPSELYRDLEGRFGRAFFLRIDAPATPRQKEVLKKLDPKAIGARELAGEPILAVLTRAPGNEAEIGGLKVITQNGWFAARPSGTEDIYKVYAESFLSETHLHEIKREAIDLVGAAFEAAGVGE